jgi:hypothetical protein
MLRSTCWRLKHSFFVWEESSLLRSVFVSFRLLINEQELLMKTKANKYVAYLYCITTEEAFYVHVTVHRNKFLFNKTNRRTNFPDLFLSRNYMFRAVPLPIIRSFPLYIRHWYMSCRFDDSFQARPGWNCSCSLVVLESCHQTCMTYTSAECTVENSWWWAEELPETYRVSWQK